MVGADVLAKLAWLESERTAGYGSRQIPDPLDDKIAALIQEWMALEHDDREMYRSIVTRRLSWVFLAFSERMATRAVRDANETWILLGLVAQGMDGWRYDERENIMVLSLHHDACRRLGVSADRIFGEAARVLPDEAGAGLSAFVRRNPTDKSLTAMGYVEGVDANGFRYQRTW